MQPWCTRTSASPRFRSCHVVEYRQLGETWEREALEHEARFVTKWPSGIDLDKLPAHPCCWDEPTIAHDEGGAFLMWEGEAVNLDDAEGLAASLLRKVREARHA